MIFTKAFSCFSDQGVKKAYKSFSFLQNFKGFSIREADIE